MGCRCGTSAEPNQWASRQSWDWTRGWCGAPAGSLRLAEPVIELALNAHHHLVERATLRLAGLSGAADVGFEPAADDAAGSTRSARSAGGPAQRAAAPWVNRLVDAVRGRRGLGHGVAVPVFHALRRRAASTTCTLLAQKAAAGSVRFGVPDGPGGDRGPAAGAAGGRRGHATGSTGAGPSGTGWSSGTATRRSGRGST